MKYPGMVTVKRVWIDDTEGIQQGSVDVLAEMEDGSLWMARFVTIPYLQQQMDYGLQVSEGLPNTPEVRYATIETRHVLVDRLDMETIEDVIEPYLIQQGFLQRTTRGRVATARTYRHFGLAQPANPVVGISHVLAGRRMRLGRKHPCQVAVECNSSRRRFISRSRT